ncbi:MAG: manganese catalase family protein [bacterium]|nr:manganese catalase family protein [bacterium]
MWNYESRLQYPVKIKKCNLKAAQVIMSQFGGPDGELAAAWRYLSQRYVQPYKEVAGLLTDIGTEELAHIEIVNAILYQLTKGATPCEIKAAGMDKYFVDHTLGQWPQSAGGVPFTATYFQSKGDPICDLHEDMAAEQKARVTYDNILRLVDDPDVCDPIRFLREREVVHFQRFGEALRITQDNLNAKNFYYINPAYDMPCKKRCNTCDSCNPCKKCGE